MSQSGRLLDLAQSLRRRRAPVTANALAQELGVSTRTVYRDISLLTARGLSVQGAPGLGYVLGADCFLPPLAFGEAELDAVMLGLRWVEKRADPELARAAQDALTKIAAVLPKRTREASETPRVFVGPDLPEPPAGVEISLFRDAVQRGLKVELNYRDGQGIASQRLVWPVGLAFMEESRFVIAWCELRGAFRHFRLDRIASAQPGGPFQERRAMLLRRWREQLAAETTAADTRRQKGASKEAAQTEASCRTIQSSCRQS